jgi:hypothetical protein
MRHFEDAGCISQERDVVDAGSGPQRRRCGRRTFVSVVVLAGVLLADGAQAWAIFISTGSGNLATDTSIPGMSSGVASNALNAVGAAGVGAAEYLGNGWVISAYHVAQQGIQVTFGGTTYSPVAGTYQQLGSTDLAVFQVANGSQYPTVTPLQLASSAPTINETVTAIGLGWGAVQPLTYYDSNFNTQPSSSGATYAGYAFDGAGGTERWGQGTLAAASLVGGAPTSATYPVSVPAYGTTSTDVFSQFYSSTAAGEFAQQHPSNNPQFFLTPSDSGGALVDQNGNLVGILEVEYLFDGQPMQSMGVFGDVSGMVSIYSYASQIEAIIVPEPTSLALTAIGFAGIVVYFWRQTGTVSQRRRARLTLPVR